MVFTFFFLVILTLLVLSASQPTLIGPLTTLQHRVSGTLYALTQHVLLLDNFRYDGKGPAAVFWLGTVPSATADGVIPFSQNTCTIVKRLPAFSGQTVFIYLPPNTVLTDFAHFSIWCKAVGVSFGGVDIDAQTAASVPQGSPECVGPAGRAGLSILMVEHQKEEPSGSDDTKEPAQTCKVKFKGDEKVYRGCVKGLEGNVEVYWTLREEDGELDTLFRAPTEGGYVGFGWGYNEMVGSNAAIAYASAAGKAMIGDFFLKSKSSTGVEPAGNQKLINVDADMAGKYVSGLFTRKLTVKGLPPIKNGRVTAIWAVGPLPSSRTSLEYHESTRGFGTIDLAAVQEDQENGAPAETPEITGPIESPSGSNGDIERPDGSPEESFEESPEEPLSVDTSDEDEAEDGGTTPSREDVCTIVFKGKKRVYKGCRKDLEGGVEVYWTVRKENGEIDTLFRAASGGGYVGFGWGYDEMVGSNAIVAYGSASGDVMINDYFLESKETEGVQPAGNQKLKNIDAEVSGMYTAGVFTRKLIVSGLPAISNGITSAIWAVGPMPNSSTSLRYHQITRGFGTIDLSVTVDSDIVIEPSESPSEEEADTNKPEGSPLDIEDGTTILPSPGEESGCVVNFKGDEKVYNGCRKGLTGDVEVYWTVRDEEEEIDTLFRAPTEGGYVGFGWGFRQMVGSSVVIAFEGDSGAEINGYFLENKSSQGVQPNDTQPLTNLDAHLDGAFVAGTFTRKMNLEDFGAIQEGRTYAILAVGKKPESPTSLEEHTERSVETIDLSSLQQAPVPSPKPTPSSSGTSEDSVCQVVFKGETRNFTGCAEGLNHGVDVYWTLREEDGELDTLFRAPTEGGYVGFGWGYSRMVGSKAVIAYQGTGVNTVINSYRLARKNTDGVQPENHGITDMEASIDGEYVAGFFTRKLEQEGLPPIRNGEIDCIWAVGARPSSETSLTTHSGRASGRIDLSKRNEGANNSGEFGPVFVAHGVMMVVAWLVIVPLAVVSMRYLKRYNPTTFQLHRGLNLFAVTFALIALLLVYTQGSHTETAHLVIGTVVGFLMILQVIVGLLRPIVESRRRRIWYAAHGGSGYTAQVLAMANVWIGLSIIGAERGYYIACGVLVGLHLLLHAVLSLMPDIFPVELKKDVTSEDEALVGAEGEENDPGP